MKEYQEFLKENPTFGYLSIRVYTASQAVPISNLKIVVQKKINDRDVVFYEGYTNVSGVIEKIPLPAPKLNLDDLKVPVGVTYDIVATYVPENVSEKFTVEIYEGVSVIQNINIALSKEYYGG